MTYYRADLSHAWKGRWNAYIRELDLLATGATKATAKENTVALIVEATGDPNPQIVWSEC